MEELLRDRNVPVRTNPPCQWCGDAGPVRTAYGEKLCASCRNIAAQQRKKMREGDSFGAAVYREMEKMARAFGERYLSAMETAEGLDIEYALASVSELVCHRDLYHGTASYLHHRFDPDQRRELIDLLFQVIRRGEARRRYLKAACSPNLDWVPPGLRTRLKPEA